MDPANFNDVQFNYLKTARHHVVQAQIGGDVVGEMHWHHTEVKSEPLTQRELPGVIADIGVDPEHNGESLRKRGIATGMWNYAHGLNVEPKPAHSPSRTKEGDAWAKKVGGRRPFTDEQARLMGTGL